LARNEFDIRRAIFLAAVCSQTYAQFNDPDGSFVIPDGYKLVSAFRAKSFTRQWERFGFIIESAQDVVIAFRGTSSTANWISDAIASQVKYKWVKGFGQSHRGISDIYNSARDSILSALGSVDAAKALYITGHSLGGALAVLCAPDAAKHSVFRNPLIYTFGAPRVGNPTFAKAFSDQLPRSCRVYNIFDAVPLLPPQVYKPPRRETTYHYMHVKEAEALQFNNGSVPANHVIGSYYRALAGQDPLFAEFLNKRNPGFCPQV